MEGERGMKGRKEGGREGRRKDEGVEWREGEIEEGGRERRQKGGERMVNEETEIGRKGWK